MNSLKTINSEDINNWNDMVLKMFNRTHSDIRAYLSYAVNIECLYNNKPARLFKHWSNKSLSYYQIMIGSEEVGRVSFCKNTLVIICE